MDKRGIVSTSTVNYFVDTNLFLQCRSLEQFDWTQWESFEEVRLIVSNPVLREIDHLKSKGSGRVGKRARATSSMFRKMRKDGQKVILDANPRVVLSVEPQHTYNRDIGERLNYQERDDQLVGTLYEFQRCHPATNVRLLTHDTTPLYTAEGLGLKVDIIPENWLLPPESTKIEKKMLSLESEIARLEKAEPSFSIRCVDQSGIELDCYGASFICFEPLTNDQVDYLMQCLKRHFPLESNFGSKEPDERVANQQTILNNLFGFSKEEYVPATEENIRKYCDEAYPEWLEQCEQILRNHHRTLQHRAPLLKFSFLAENKGTRPATDTLVSIEAHGRFQIQPPSTDVEDDAQSDGDNELTNLKAEGLFRPPIAPRGFWKRVIGGQQGAMFRAIDAFKHLSYKIPEMEHIPNWNHTSLLHDLDVRPVSHDPNSFYYKSRRPSSASSSFSLCCDQWRHDDGEELFEGEIHLPVDEDKLDGALLFRIQASNLSKSACKQIPVRIKIAHVSAFESARTMVEKLSQHPRQTAAPSQRNISKDTPLDQTVN